MKNSQRNSQPSAKVNNNETTTKPQASKKSHNPQAKTQPKDKASHFQKGLDSK